MTIKIKKVEEDSTISGLKAKPGVIKGAISVAGKIIEIGAGAVSYQKGATSEQLIKKLREASKKDLFPVSALMAND